MVFKTVFSYILLRSFKGTRIHIHCHRPSDPPALRKPDRDIRMVRTDIRQYRPGGHKSCDRLKSL